MNVKKYKNTAIAALAVMIVLLLGTISMAPIFGAYAEEEEEIEEDSYVTASLISNGTGDAIKWWLRVIPVTSSVMGIYDYYNLDNGRLNPPAGNDDEIKAYARNVDALRSAQQQYNVMMVASNLVDNDTQTWKLTDAYLNRAAEIATGTLWHSGATFDGDGILDFGGIYSTVSTGNLNTQDVLDQAIKVTVDLRDLWDATNYGQSLDISLVWDGGGTGDATSRLYSDFFTLANVSAGKDVIYLSQSDADNISITNSTVWAYSGLGSITSIETPSLSMSLSAGANDVSALPAGFYRLTPGVYGGSFLSSTSLNSAPVEGAMGIICDDKIGYVVSEGENLKIHYNGLNYVSSNLDYQITGGGDPQDSHGAPKALVQSYADYINQLTDLLYESAQAAMVMWSISAQANDSNILLSPSSIIPNLTNVGIDAAQAYALYIMSLDQIAQYNANYGGQLQAGMTKVSAESLDLYCHGTIYDADGTPAVSNAIFTPYVYLTDWLISANQFNTFGQNGLIMIWDIADTAIGWDIADADDYQAVVVSKGMYFMADEILYEGATVQSIKLDVDEVQRISVFDEISWPRPDTPAVLDASTLIMIIMIELGIIIGLIGYILRMPSLMATGLIVALIGIFANSFIAKLLLRVI